MSLAVPTSEQVLESLKNFVRYELRDTQKIVSTVKAGILDERDELPCLGITPISELVSTIYNDNLISITRDYYLSLIAKGYTIDEVKRTLHEKLVSLKALFSVNTASLKWNMLNSDYNVQCWDLDIGREALDAPLADSEFLRFIQVPLSLKSFYQIENPIIPTLYKEISFIELLDYIYEEIKKFSVFPTTWRDQQKPVSLDNLPAIGIFVQEPDEDKLEQTSTEKTQVTIVFRIYSSLASREIAFINHMRNVETVKAWIFKNTILDGCVSSFDLTSLDYGVDFHSKTFQNNPDVPEMPIFRTDITTVAMLQNFKEG